MLNNFKQSLHYYLEVIKPQLINKNSEKVIIYPFFWNSTVTFLAVRMTYALFLHKLEL